MTSPGQPEPKGTLGGAGVRRAGGRGPGSGPFSFGIPCAGAGSGQASQLQAMTSRSLPRAGVEGRPALEAVASFQSQAVNRELAKPPAGHFQSPLGWGCGGVQVLALQKGKSLIHKLGAVRGSWWQGTPR